MEQIAETGTPPTWAHLRVTPRIKLLQDCCFILPCLHGAEGSRWHGAQYLPRHLAKLDLLGEIVPGATKRMPLNGPLDSGKVNLECDKQNKKGFVIICNAINAESYSCSWLINFQFVRIHKLPRLWAMH